MLGRANRSSSPSCSAPSAGASGAYSRDGSRAAYPLALTRAQALTGTRTVLIGNAAQALHPVAAQGFNLGLRDAAMLAEVFARGRDPGAADVLAALRRARAPRPARRDRLHRRLVKLFGEEHPALAGLRNLGLLLFDLRRRPSGAGARELGLRRPDAAPGARPAAAHERGFRSSS